jgi:hypothetical protein
MENAIMYCPQNHFKNTFLSCNRFFQLLEPVLFYTASASRALLSKEDPAEEHFSPIRRSLMKLEHEHQDAYDKIFFYTIYRISLSYNYRMEKSAVQAYISSSISLTLN